MSAGCPIHSPRRRRGPPELRQSGKEPEIVFTHLMEAIGLALDLKGGRMLQTSGVRSTAPTSMDRTGGRCSLLKETSPALHTRRCRPNIERQPRIIDGDNQTRFTQSQKEALRCLI